MNNIIPSVGKTYEVISGPFQGFIGDCVSYDMEESNTPIILCDKNWNSRAVKLDEVKSIDKPYTGFSNNTDISHLQKN